MQEMSDSGGKPPPALRATSASGGQTEEFLKINCRVPSCFIQGTRHRFQDRFFLLLFILPDVEFVFDKLHSRFSLPQCQGAQAVRSDEIEV